MVETVALQLPAILFTDQVEATRVVFIAVIALYILAFVVVAIQIRKVKEVFNIKAELCGA